MDNRKIHRKKKEISEELEEVVEDSRELAESLGLDPRPVNYWVVDYEEMAELAAYEGFQTRYPHWRWGEKYDRQKKEWQYFGGKAFEMVNNDTPSHAFLQMSNTVADQKAVITHVEAHSDFFKNNRWFQDEPNASEMLERHSRKIREYMEDPDISRDEVEEFIDVVLTLSDNIDQYSSSFSDDDDDEQEVSDTEEKVENLGVRESVQEQVFDSEWVEFQEMEKPKPVFEDNEKDLLAFLLANGKKYDDIQDKAVDFEEWQVDILDMIRKEAYYFAPQKMTKVMNEGWAAYWESVMMANEEFAGEEEIIDYADHQSRVLQSGNFNPYSLGKSIWEYIENTVNRREVVSLLLRIDGINPENFHNKVDFQEVNDILSNHQSPDPEQRHYSLIRPQNQGFIQNISRSKLEEISRYLFETERYNNVKGALSDVDYGAGWKRMREIRETHNDVMFIDEFLTQEFVDAEKFFTYELSRWEKEMQIASRDVEDVRKKLLLQFTNFGKPTIVAVSDNFDNTGELLLAHKYNGVMLDVEKAKETLSMIFQMWGRPVNLATVARDVSEEEMEKAYLEGRKPDENEAGVRLRYDGEIFEEYPLRESLNDFISADEVDYDTRPDEGWT